jgi:hypothetical protein
LGVTNRIPSEKNLPLLLTYRVCARRDETFPKNSKKDSERDQEQIARSFFLARGRRRNFAEKTCPSTSMITPNDREMAVIFRKFFKKTGIPTPSRPQFTNVSVVLLYEKIVPLLVFGAIL